MQNQYQGKERRKYRRFKADLTVFYRPDQPIDAHLRTLERDTHATMVDIGEGGMCIVTDMELTVKTNLHIRFALVDTQEESTSFYGAIEVLGEVRYCNKLGSNSYRIGISFEKMDKINRLEIAHFLEILEKQGKQK